MEALIMSSGQSGNCTVKSSLQYFAASLPVSSGSSFVQGKAIHLMFRGPPSSCSVKSPLQQYAASLPVSSGFAKRPRSHFAHDSTKIQVQGSDCLEVVF